MKGYGEVRRSVKYNDTGYIMGSGDGGDAEHKECTAAGSLTHNARHYNIAMLAQRSDRLKALLSGGLEAAGVSADVTVYSGKECDVLAAFDTRFPVRPVRPNEGCIPVVYSGSGRVRRALGGCGLPCVSCGTAAYDTVTVSSIARGSAMLTVQRELGTAYGGIIEPCEIPVVFSGCDIYKALLCAAVVLVCGGPPERGVIELRPLGGRRNAVR